MTNKRNRFQLFPTPKEQNQKETKAVRNVPQTTIHRRHQSARVSTLTCLLSAPDRDYFGRTSYGSLVVAGVCRASINGNFEISYFIILQSDNEEGLVIHIQY